MKQKTPDLTGFGKGPNAGFEFFPFGRSPVPFLMRKLLPHLDRKIEIIRRAFRPRLGSFRGAWSVERGIDFDRVEVS